MMHLIRIDIPRERIRLRTFGFFFGRVGTVAFALHGFARLEVLAIDHDPT
jgi:hypothetical protein